MIAFIAGMVVTMAVGAVSIVTRMYENKSIEHKNVHEIEEVKHDE